MSGGPGLEPLVDQMISVITNDGRHIVGMLRGFDQATNLILDESHERVYSTQVGQLLQKTVCYFYIVELYHPDICYFTYLIYFFFIVPFFSFLSASSARRRRYRIGSVHH
ncbi:hypothetical protein Drorol1_Dr00002107 [Drosera rotundifolia]